MTVHSGGVPEEAVYLAQGRCIHSKRSGRWGFPEELVRMRAMWLCETSVEDVGLVDLLEI